MNTIENLFVRRIPVKLISLLKSGGSTCNTTKLSKLVDTSPFMVRLILSKMLEHNIVEKNKEGRNTFYNLTEKGIEIADALQILHNCIFFEKSEKKTGRNAVDEIRSGESDGRVA